MLDAKKDMPEASASPLVRALGKPPAHFTRRDILRFIREHGIRSLHFRYPAQDGKLKELKLPVNDLRDTEAILAEGERVDGSNLLKGMVDAGRSDMYVVPMYQTAYLSPFVPDCIEFLCRYLDGEGNPAPFTPDNILARSEESFKRKTGCELLALGELEFYLIYPEESDLYPGTPQGFYHEAAPFVRWDDLVEEILRTSSEICGGVKYCHSEVGYIRTPGETLPEFRGKRMSQYELEFLPAPLQKAAGRLLIAKWLIRNLAARRGILVTFAPKLNLGDAGSGLHFHLSINRNGKNVLTDKTGKLTPEALAAIGGLLKFSGSLTAFGNTCAASYLRLVPHQEAPVRVCWSASNRSALVRVPLGWRGVDNLASRVNAQQPGDFHGEMFGQTVEIRSPDGSADVYLLLAGLGVAVREGLLDGRDSMRLAKELEATSNIFDDKKALSRLRSLPRSCWESARELEKDRAVYEADGVYPPKVIDFCIGRLDGEKDKDLAKDVSRMPPKKRAEALRRIMLASLHCM
jgi:glutamine synthetase